MANGGMNIFLAILEGDREENESDLINFESASSSLSIIFMTIKVIIIIIEEYSFFNLIKFFIGSSQG